MLATKHGRQTAFLLGALVSLTGCGNSEHQSVPKPVGKSAAAVEQEFRERRLAAEAERAKQRIPEDVEPGFSANRSSMIGDWYILLRHGKPEYENKIAINYLRFTFREDGTVTERGKSGNKTTYRPGTFKFDSENGVAYLLFDRHLQITWRQTSAGRAQTIHFKNLREGNEHNSIDTFVKIDSQEWDKHQKIEL